MKNMTLENIAKACGGELVLHGVDEKKEISGAVLDSRLVKKNYLFFATKGERADGHDFIGKAFELGAAAAVCERIPKGVKGNFIIVQDTFVALKQIAKFYRTQLNIKVVGITGSVGKTSTKEFIASVLAEKYNVLKTEGNFNNEVGLPLTVLKLRDEHEVAVLEMGISDFGEMTRLSMIAQPDVCVITNIGQCHLEQLGDRDGVLKAKTEVFANLKDGGTACLFAEDDKLAGIHDVNGKKPVFYGMKETADVYAEQVVNKGLLGSECVIHTAGKEVKAQIPLPGKHMVYNALAAVAVAEVFGLSAKEMEEGIRNVQAVSGRSHIISTDNYTIIDDCYNANPVSMKAAIDLLGEADTRKVAILGDMFELGEKEKDLHRQVGEYVADSDTDVLVCVGELSSHMYQGAGQKNKEVHHYATLEECKNQIADVLKPKDSILIKASHGMHFEEIVELLTQGVTSEVIAEVSDEDRTEEREVSETAQEAKTEQSQEAEEKIEEADQNASELPVQEAVANTEEEEMGDTNRNKEAVEAAYNKAMDEVIKTPIGTTTPPNADANSQAFKKNKKILFIVIAVLAALIIGCIIGLIAYNKHYKSMTQGVLLYHDSGQMMGEKVFADVVYSTQWNSWNFNEKGAVNDSNPAATTTDGKYLYFAMNGSYTYFDLYYTKVGSDKATLIAQGVTDYEVTGKGVVYYVSNNGFYQYLVKDGSISNLCNDATTFRLNEKKDTALVLGGANATLATIKLDEPGSYTVVENGVLGVIEASDDLNTIVYQKADGLYIVNKDGEKTLVTKEYAECHIYNIDKKCEIYYLTAERGLYYFKDGADASELVTTDVWRLHGADSEAAMFFAAIGPISEQCIYKLVEGGEAIAMKDVSPMEIGDEIYFDTSGKKAYFIGYSNDNDRVGTLYSMGYQMLDKGKVEVVENNVVSIELADGKKMFLGKDDGNGSVDLYYDGVLVARNIIANSLTMTADERAYVFAYPIADGDGDRMLALYDGNAVWDIGSSAGDHYCAVSAKEIYFVQYGESGYDLMKYNGRKVKVQLESVDNYHYLFY